jgi:hypothetical protein
VILGMLSLFPLLAPYELLWRVQWTNFLNLFFVLAAVISVGAAALSGILIFAAVAGLSSRITLDSARSTFTYSERAPVVRQRTRVLPLSSLQSVQVRTHEWSDGAPSFSLTFRMADGSELNTGSSWMREDVESGKIQVERFLEQAVRRT